VSFLERQSKFGWHSGMQLPGTKMQISFLKDLATPRQPRSRFTFINYLHAKNRLNTFINLSTFLPSRAEYEDYLRWCAGHFEEEGIVAYGQEVVAVVPKVFSTERRVTAFEVTSRDIKTSEITSRLARHVVIAVGGRPVIPSAFPANHPLVFHSSSYSHHHLSNIPATLSNPQDPYHIAVIGNGQSAAEIFNDLSSRYPHAKVTLIIKGSALRPSDDSPFVNDIFNPDRVDGIFSQKAEIRASALHLDRGTNYGVVRLSLLEHLYEKLYAQRLSMEKGEGEKIAIRNNREVYETQSIIGSNRQERLLLKLKNVVEESRGTEKEELAVDAVFVATGYIRNAHEGMLRSTRELLPTQFQAETAKFPVRRDYKVAFEASKVDDNAGVWLQGCNEKTHGV
jgi:L-ornithine N5-oxygenase